MKIAFFVGGFPEVSETFILHQITGLIDLGHEVDIYSEGRPKDNSAIHPDVFHYNLLTKTTYLNDYMPEASGLWEMPVWPVTAETWLPGSERSIPNQQRVTEAAPHLIRCLLENPKLAFEVLDSDEYGIEADSLSALYRLSVLMGAEKNYDILHAHFGPVASSIRFASELWNAPLVATFHGYDMCTVPRVRGFDVYNKTFKTVTLVTSHSDYARSKLQQLECPSDKIRKLHVGVKPEDFPFKKRSLLPKECLRILSVARLVEIKGLEYSIRAVAEVAKLQSNIRYDIIGAGPEKTKLENLISELELGNIVQLHGARDSRYVQALMSNAHIFLLPSINLHGDQEGTPVSLMEAQASGIPVLATNTGGISEVIIDGRSGFLCEERNVASLTDRILYLVKNSEMWPQLGQTGRLHVENNFNIKFLNRELVMIYEEAISNRSKA